MKEANRTCKQCNKAFYARPSYAKRAYFCSRSCYYKHGKRPIKERFWEKVKIGTRNECWEWTGALLRGYGLLHANRRSSLAHRISYILNIGPIQEGMCICHHCDNPKCVNPDHLFMATMKVNMLDAAHKKRMAHGKHHGSVTHPESIPRGEKNGHAKLTGDKIQEIRSLVASGLSQRKVAKIYRVHYTTIRHIYIHKTWRHIPAL